MTKAARDQKFDDAQKFLTSKFEKAWDQAVLELDAFCQEISKHPGYALESADRSFENAAKVEILGVLLKRLNVISDLNGLDVLVKEYEEAVVFSAMRGSRSTSDTRNLMEEMRLAVKADATRDMRDLLNGYFRKG